MSVAQAATRVRTGLGWPAVSLLALVASAYAALLWALRTQWLLGDASGYVETDFGAFWAAGRLALDGEAAAAWDWARHRAIAVAGIGPEAWRFPWLYPPSFLLLVAPFAALIYPVALLGWVGSTLATFCLAMRAIVGRPEAFLAALAFPAVLINAVTGQAGLLTATLLGGGLAVLPARPILAGLFFGLLTIKPQLGLLLPLALAAGGFWRAFATAAAVAIGLFVVSTLTFGLESWTAFVEGLGRTGQAVLGDGQTGFSKMQSLYGVVRGLGGGHGFAGLCQGALALGCAASVWALWRGREPFETKAAALAVAALLVQPYVFIYDSAVLAVALAFLARGAWRGGGSAVDASVAVGVAAVLLGAFGGTPHAGLMAALLTAGLVARRAADLSRSGEGARPALDAPAFAAHNGGAKG